MCEADNVLMGLAIWGALCFVYGFVKAAVKDLREQAKR